MTVRSRLHPTRTPVLRALAAVALLAGVLVADAGPAAADPPVTSFTTPAEDEVFTVANPVIAGEVRMTNGILVEDLRVEVVSKWEHPGASTIVPALARPAQSFSFNPTLSYNGPYQAFVTATGKDLSLDLRTDTAVTTRGFSLAVPPVAPTGVQAIVDPVSRATTVGWSANPEPDIIGYEVRRSPASAARAVVVGVTAETSLVDRGTVAEGGEFDYQVRAVRVGASAESGVISELSSPTTVTVRGSPTGAAPSTTGLRPPTARPPNGAGVDASSFRAKVREADNTKAVAPSSQEPAFEPVLPVAESGSYDSDLSDAELGTAVSENGQSENRQSLYFVAAGLLAFVLVAQIRWLIRVVDRSPPV